MTSALEIQRKSARYIPSWPLLPPDEPCVRFCHLVWSVTKPTVECIQQEKNRVITLWKELTEEDKAVYYQEYQDDLETYWRLQMVICGCHTCKEAVAKHQGFIDVTHFIQKLKQNQEKMSSQNHVPIHIQKTSKELSINPQSNQNLPSCDVVEIPVASSMKTTLMPADELQQEILNENDTTHEEYSQIEELSMQVDTPRNSSVVVEIIPVNTSVNTQKPTDELQQEFPRKTNSFKSFCNDTHERTTQVKELSEISSPTMNSSLKRKCSNYYLELSRNFKETGDSDVSNNLYCNQISVNVAKRGYPFTTSNCMDFSSDESDFLDEVSFRNIPTTLLSADRSSPYLTSHQDSSTNHNSVTACSILESSPGTLLPEVAASGCPSIFNLETSMNDVPSMVANDCPFNFNHEISSTVDNSIPECSPDSLLPEMAATGCPSISNLETSINNVPSSNCMTCLPLSTDFSDRSHPSLLNHDLQTNKLAFLEIKKIFIEMILEKLRYFKSLRMEKEIDDQHLDMPNIDMYEDDINNDNNENANLNSCVPEFVPINKTLRRCTWQLLIENEARKNYNRKVTLKLNWTSKGGEPIQCVDSKGMELDIHSMQPFVRLQPLKSLKTPIVLNTNGNNLFARIERKRVDFRPKRRLRKPMRFCQFRSKENFRIRKRKRKDQTLDGPVVCDVCNLGFTDQQTFIIHRASCKELMRGKSVQPIFDCSLTRPLDDRDGAESKMNVEQHCTVCAGSFTDHILREIHMYMAHKATRLCCNICGFTFGNNARYLAHIVDHQKLQCMICKILFETVEQLNKHLTFDHLEFKCYCKKCDMVLATIFLYQGHMLEHLTIRLFSCSVCTKRFKRKYNLVGHLWTHKPHGYKCVHCRLSFPRPHLLNGHNRKVHGLLAVG